MSTEKIIFGYAYLSLCISFYLCISESIFSLTFPVLMLQQNFWASLLKQLHKSRIGLSRIYNSVTLGSRTTTNYTIVIPIVLRWPGICQYNSWRSSILDYRTYFFLQNLNLSYLLYNQMLLVVTL